MRAKLIVVAACLVSVTTTAGAVAAVDEKLNLKLIATDGFYIDNGQPGQSGGDLFGSDGIVRRGGEQVGKSSSACEATSASRGICNATLIIQGRGRLALSGIVRPLAPTNRLVITGGSADFRGAQGKADLVSLSQDGSKQQVTIYIHY